MLVFDILVANSRPPAAVRQTHYRLPPKFAAHPRTPQRDNVLDDL